MKLAIIDPVGLKAGMNCYDLGLLNALQQKGADVFVFSNFTDHNFPCVHQENIFLSKKRNKIITLCNFICAHFRALFICRKNKINWVLLHIFSTTAKDYFSFLVTKLFRCSIIAVVHDIDALTEKDNHTLKQKIYNLSDILVVHNETSEKIITPLLNKKNKEKLKVIPHGNYADFVMPQNSNHYFINELELKQGFKYLLFFGQIKKVKGLDILLHSVPLLPEEYKIIIAGRPQKDDFAYYRDIINRLDIGNRVISIIRYITDEERDFLFKNSDALVLPYRKIFQSGVLLLAMSYGLPVIASDLPANKEIITDGYNGMLFTEGDPQSLGLKIKTLFSNHDINKIKTNIYATINHQYSWPAIADQYGFILAGKN